jgi:hypothetical protein
VWSPKAHEAKSAFRCETHFHRWGRVQGLKPNDSQVHSHFGSYTRMGVVNIQSLGWKGKQTPIGLRDTIKKFLKRRCLKCLHIIHLYLICMSYDQKKRHESNFQPQIPCKKGSNEVQLERPIHFWKDVFKGYKMLLSHFQNKLDLKKIWVFKVLGQQDSQFWDSHLGILGKSDIWMFYREGSGDSSQRLWAMWSICLRLPLLSPSHHFHSTCTNRPLFLVV